MVSYVLISLWIQMDHTGCTKTLDYTVHQKMKIQSISPYHHADGKPGEVS